MLSEISDRLTRVIEDRRSKTKLEQDLRRIKASLDENTRQLEDLEQKLQKEKVDVERLERLSLTGLFYTLLGSREQQVEKEHQQLLSAQLKYQQMKRVVETLRADQASLERQLDSLRGVDAEYASLLEQKEALLRQADPRVAGELARLSEEIAARNAEKKEIDEATAAASAVLSGLVKVIDALSNAEGWGAWDILGGGFLSTAIKHSHIDEARAAAEDVQAKMTRFTRELADLEQSLTVQIDIGDLATFADYFFDGLIVDWIVQERIDSSLEQSRRARDKIYAVVDDLKNLSAAAQEESRQLSRQRAALIEQG